MQVLTFLWSNTFYPQLSTIGDSFQILKEKHKIEGKFNTKNGLRLAFWHILPRFDNPMVRRVYHSAQMVVDAHAKSCHHRQVPINTQNTPNSYTISTGLRRSLYPLRLVPKKKKGRKQLKPRPIFDSRKWKTRSKDLISTFSRHPNGVMNEIRRDPYKLISA